MPPASLTPQGRVIGLKTLLALVPISRTTIWRLEKNGLFKKRIQLTQNRVGWDLGDIERWIAGKKGE
jgi:prophage regulatory protein